MENRDTSPEMERFNTALHEILQVPKKELVRLLAEEKQAKSGKVRPGPKPKVAQGKSQPREGIL